MDRNNATTGRPDRRDRHARGLGAFEYRFGSLGGHDITGLILAKPEGGGGKLGGGLENRPEAGGPRHFHHGDENAAVGNIVCSRDQAIADKSPHEVAMLALGGQIDRGRSPLLPSANVAQIDRLPKPAASLANNEDSLAFALEGHG